MAFTTILYYWLVTLPTRNLIIAISTALFSSEFASPKKTMSFPVAVFVNKGWLIFKIKHFKRPPKHE